jgi:DNA-binding IscR family transcriptional regulator
MGVNGGYELAKKPCEISLYDVMSVIDGEYRFNRCVDDSYVCSRTGEQKDCKFHRIFCGITDDIVGVLKSHTFDQFIENS